MKSWIDVPPDHPFPFQNLPYCAFFSGTTAAVGVGIGDYVLDLSLLFDAGFLPKGVAGNNVFAHPHLNAFMALGRDIWAEVRAALTDLLREDNGALRDDDEFLHKALHKQVDVELLLPVNIGAFVDFYSSERHATNVGSMFRPDNPLMPNWKWLPVGYNGRASSVVASGTPIRRPVGQSLPGKAQEPVFGPCRNLDFELEMGFFTGKENPLGARVGTSEAADYIFGMTLVNDWSARDIQKWEYQPLGPFLAKTFATTISPWVVPMAALEPFRISNPAQIPPPMNYLRCEEDWTFDIELEVALQTEAMRTPQVISRSNYKNMYWNMAQQLAHQCVNGTNVQVGDLYASGTISGDDPSSFGSMLELTWRGEKPIEMTETGETRAFIQDGDTVFLKGYCQGEGYRVGFGEASGTILPASL
ncbi:MAG TPA: fumarylacetoacetase [Fimbriimonadales bacterium]|jgi:fumarylacetoacetase|nr:fumarylacetoacetase [Fimbriimonadales bacterium]